MPGRQLDGAGLEAGVVGVGRTGAEAAGDPDDRLAAQVFGGGKVLRREVLLVEDHL